MHPVAVHPLRARAEARGAPRALRRWLGVPASLSAQLDALARECGQVYAVQRLAQGVGGCSATEQAALAPWGRDRLLVREVLLRVGDTPLVWARSVTPRRALGGPWRALGPLGTRPLADLLFSPRGATRSELHARRLAARCPEVRALRRALARFTPALGPVLARRAPWARLSVFWRHGMPLRVLEVFLPGAATRTCPATRQPWRARTR